MIAPARLAAYDVLRAVNASRADLPAALAHARARLPDERDRALAGEIATGTLRWQGAFDQVIATFAGRPVSRLDPEVLDILRLTMFQLLHLDRVPASAAVNDAVDLTRKAGKKSAGALVNALLRRVGRERRDLPLPRRPAADATSEEGLDYLSITLSHPRWFAARLVERYGFDAADAWCRFDNEAARLTLRANTLQTSRSALADQLKTEGIETSSGRFAPAALIVESGNPLGSELHRKGLFAVQDEASQLVAAFAGARRDERVLDACASPGGKASAMASDMNDSGLLIASDVRPRRIELLKDAVKASGARIIHVVQADAAQRLPFRDVFDRVVVDAPCSGLGTLRRDPDIRWRRTPDELPRLAAAELRILSCAAETVRPGGRLIYATCSSEPEENEDVVASFVARHPGFRVVPARALELPEYLRPLVNEAGHLRTYPFRDGLEAFFAAQLEKAANFG
jgi:16S rRNA (cytosine967-C5)-methyltransferase